MHLTILPAFFEVSRTVVSTCTAGIVLLSIGLLAVRRDLPEASGLEKIVVLANLCFAAPLAVFGAEHLSAASGISQLVPKFMPWPLFWTYFVGLALIAASLSIATRIQVQWSGLLFGIMMFLFVAMMDLPGTLQNLHSRISWALLCREMSFGAGGWCLASAAMDRARAHDPGLLLTVGRIVIGLAAMVYGVEHFLHPLNVPGVPLEKIMPAWIPARPVISYLTGIILLLGGAAILFTRKLRIAASYLGTWIFLIVLFVYGPVLITALLAPGTDVKVKGINYFFDTLLYAGTILGLASAAPQEN
jgi:uncharacterized membrane protein